MKRNPRKVKWTKAYRKLAGKELAEVCSSCSHILEEHSQCCLPATNCLCFPQPCLNCVQDTTFEMERRRNRPEKYNREVVAKTLNAIKKISKIRVRRQERFYEQRMRNAKKVARVVAKNELEKQVRFHKLQHKLFVYQTFKLAPVHIQYSLPEAPCVLLAKHGTRYHFRP